MRYIIGESDMVWLQQSCDTLHMMAVMANPKASIDGEQLASFCSLLEDRLRTVMELSEELPDKP